MNYVVLKVEKLSVRGYRIPSGSRVVLLEPVGPDDLLLEAAIPDETLVGGLRFDILFAKPSEVEASADDPPPSEQQ